MKIQW